MKALTAAESSRTTVLTRGGHGSPIFHVKELSKEVSGLFLVSFKVVSQT